MATKPTRFAQMGDTTEKVKAYTGIPKQLVVDTAKWKIHLMDGSTPGGYVVAMAADVTAGLAQKVDTAELETALKELIVEFGGQVPV